MIILTFTFACYQLGRSVGRRKEYTEYTNKEMSNNWKQSKYKKIIRISIEDLDFLKQEKDKKSLAGFLEEIIKYYKDENNLH